VQVRQLFGKLRFVLQIADAAELRLEWRQPLASMAFSSMQAK